MRPRLHVLGWACALAVLPPPARAESSGDIFTPAQRTEITRLVRDALRQDPDILRDAIAGLQRDEARRVRAAHAGAIAAERQALFADPADPVAGDPRGTATLVEFYDPRCPYCRAMPPVLAALMRDLPRLRVVYKDMPVLGAASMLQSRALLAAARQNAYLRLQDALMRAVPADAAASRGATEEAVLRAARQAGLDVARLQADMRDPAIAAHLDSNLKLARRLGIEGTPAFVAGDRLLSGAADETELREALRAAR